MNSEMKTYMNMIWYSVLKGLSKGVIGTATHVYSKYNDYGCHCGGGRSGGTPVDATDKWDWMLLFFLYINQWILAFFISFSFFINSKTVIPPY